MANCAQFGRHCINFSTFLMRGGSRSLDFESFQRIKTSILIQYGKQAPRSFRTYSATYTCRADDFSLKEISQSLPFSWVHWSVFQSMYSLIPATSEVEGLNSESLSKVLVLARRWRDKFDLNSDAPIG